MNEPILHLNLKRKWFDMIKSGEKKEEYREIKPFWNRIFKPSHHVKIKGTWYPCSMVKVTFSNGYSKDRDQFQAKIAGIRFNSKGREEWGADKNKNYYVLEINRII